MEDTVSVVLVVGSLHYDIMVDADHLPKRDETAVGSRWYPKFGGKGGNQAVAARQAGAVTRMVGAVGQDRFGEFLLTRLHAEAVDCTAVARLAGIGSGMSVAISDQNGDYAATIVSGANLLVALSAVEDAELWRDVKVLVLQNEIPEAINLAAARSAKRYGAQVVLNAAPARELPLDMRDLVDVLVVNSVEAEMLGTAPVTDLPSAILAASHLAKAYRSVVVTAGAAGLAHAAGSGCHALMAEKVVAISNHGAGDCFTGTLAHALARGADLDAASKVASQAAARHVSGGGRNVFEPVV